MKNSVNLNKNSFENLILGKLIKSLKKAIRTYGTAINKILIEVKEPKAKIEQFIIAYI